VILRKARVVLVFVFAATIILYFIASGFEISRVEGYDPWRYLFLSRSGVTSQELGSGYRILDFLQAFNYVDSSIYLPFLVFSFICYLYVFQSICFDMNSLALWASSSLASYYLVQTGKDGFISIACLAIIVFFASYKSLKFLHIAFLSLLVFIAIFVRLESIIYLIACLAIVHRRFVILNFFIISVLALLILRPDLHDIFQISILDDTAFYSASKISSSYLAFALNSYSLNAVIARTVAYLCSPFLIPIYYLASNALNPNIDLINIFLALPLFACSAYFLRHKDRFVYYLSCAFPLGLALSFSPIIHFRYFFVLIPSIIVSSEIFSAKSLSKSI